MDFLSKSSGYENTVLFTQYATHIQVNLQQTCGELKDITVLYDISAII
jgi:hypothetical protein